MKAHLINLSPGPERRQRLTIELDGDFREQAEARKLFDDLRERDVDVTIKPYRKKRSLDANALYWFNLTRLARALHTSNPELHNIMLRRYGQMEMYDGQLAYVMIPDTDDAAKKADCAETYHIKPTTGTKPGKDGTTYRAYILLRGSSTYDSAEMSRLIEGLESECEQAGVVFLSESAESRRALLDDGKKE